MISRLDFDSVFGPCYFDDKEEADDFYLPAQMPNVDMWKKFELLPTPPLSPRRECDIPYSLLDTDVSSIHLRLSDLDEKDHPPEKVLYPETPPSLTSCQDPMWSGHVMDGEIQRFNEQPLQYEAKPVTMRTSTPSVDLGPNESECIDPQSVFAISLPAPHTEPACRNMGTDTPSDSEEEIDVVSIANKNRQHQMTMSSTLLSHALSEVHTTHNYSKPHIHVSYTSNKNSQKRTMKLVIPSSSLLKRNKSTDTCETTPAKRSKRDLPILLDMTVAESLDTGDSRTCLTATRKGSPRGSLDSWDADCSDSQFGPHKRNQHNVLERKRRNDLKSSFYLLRDEVPELMKLERAPKVLILQKAQEHIVELQVSQAALQKEMEKHRITRKRLTAKLHRLQNLDLKISKLEA